MSWFMRHLNWTLILPLVMLIVFSILSDGNPASIFALLGGICLVLLFVVTPWVLYQKGYSLWWMLLYPTTILIFSFVLLCSRNKRKIVNTPRTQ